MSAPPGAGPSLPAPPAPAHPLRPLSARTASAPLPAAVSALDGSHLDDGGSAGAAASTSFTSALAMLLYDVLYAAHTQAVDVPLAHAGEVLGNLWAVCCSPELGKRSHATGCAARLGLPPPTPPGFALEFAQLLQATAAHPSRAARVRAGTVGGGAPGRRAREEREAVVEEEEEWDLVDDVSG